MSLQVKIRKAFPSFELNVDFDVENETFGFLGASGCGKSLTLRCIAGIEKPDAGRIVVNGRTFYDSVTGINLSPQERKTALLFQNYMLFPNLTVEQNIAAGLPKGTSKQDEAAAVAHEVGRFSLAGLEKRYPSQLSGGQQQRVALARMFAARPGILMLDEPFSALDAHLKGVLEQDLLRVFREFEGSILYVSHDIDEALRFCNRIAVVDAGRIVEVDTGRELVDHPRSLAALKLSGCKNIVRAHREGDHEVHVPAWNARLKVEARVPEGTTHIGFRAASIQVADASAAADPEEARPAGTAQAGDNVFRAFVERTSDDRFDRMALLRLATGEEGVEAGEEDNRLFWRISTRGPRGEAVPGLLENLPREGDVLSIRIPAHAIHAVQ